MSPLWNARPVAARGGGQAVQFALTTVILLASWSAWAQPLRLPTANRALLDADGGGEKYFVGTTSKPWQSGTFGCVRSDGSQLHEGLDIRSIQRDRRGEPTDPILAAADGTVGYVSRAAGDSNYGRYIVLRHTIEGLELLTLYAHLAEIPAEIVAGRKVKRGDRIAVMGRTTNTRESIVRERAHLHFEIDLMINPSFATWHARQRPGERNEHGNWNGRNLIGLDPRAFFLQQASEGAAFSVRDFLRNQRELCRVLVRSGDLAWARRFPSLVRRSRNAEREGVAAYEVRLNFNGVPFQLTPRAPSELKPGARFELLSVNAAEQQRCPCRRLVESRGAGWELTSHGRELLELLVW